MLEGDGVDTCYGSFHVYLPNTRYNPEDVLLDDTFWIRRALAEKDNTIPVPIGTRGVHYDQKIHMKSWESTKRRYRNPRQVLGARCRIETCQNSQGHHNLFVQVLNVGSIGIGDVKYKCP